uniref:Bifunctional inhibitor/plant lipid transfer protein/seed storage helical domain-containing protein n=1 Tax=Setaria viridis TaxID=4556 RepID=A0A4U6TCX1_SETVI|nr:hypothetical protein SEVIR_8G076800v2 [Setaria viridis]
MRGKIAPLLIVLLFLPIDHVIGSCTTAQKDAILEHCEDVCCNKVREVPGMDMECIVRLLTNAEKARHSEKRIKGLPFCPLRSPPPPRRQMMV